MNERTNGQEHTKRGLSGLDGPETAAGAGEVVQNGANLVRFVRSEAEVALASGRASANLDSEDAGHCVDSVAPDAGERPVDGLRRVVLERERDPHLGDLQEADVDDPALHVHVLDSILLGSRHELGAGTLP